MTTYPRDADVNVDVDDRGVISFLGERLTLDGLPKALKKAGVDTDRRVFINVPSDFSPRLKSSMVTVLARSNYLNIKFRWGEKKISVSIAPPADGR